MRSVERRFSIDGIFSSFTCADNVTQCVSSYNMYLIHLSFLLPCDVVIHWQLGVTTFGLDDERPQFRLSFSASTTASCILLPNHVRHCQSTFSSAFFHLFSLLLSRLNLRQIVCRLSIIIHCFTCRNHCGVVRSSFTNSFFFSTFYPDSVFFWRFYFFVSVLCSF